MNFSNNSVSLAAVLVFLVSLPSFANAKPSHNPGEERYSFDLNVKYEKLIGRNFKTATVGSGNFLVDVAVAGSETAKQEGTAQLFHERADQNSGAVFSDGSSTEDLIRPFFVTSVPATVLHWRDQPISILGLYGAFFSGLRYRAEGMETTFMHTADITLSSEQMTDLLHLVNRAASFEKTIDACNVTESAFRMSGRSRCENYQIPCIVRRDHGETPANEIIESNLLIEVCTDRRMSTIQY
jgi:hypothetical protein